MTMLRWTLMLGMTLFIAACGDSGPTETQQIAHSGAADPPSEPACELVMGWDPWEPYQYEVAGDNVFGLDVDLLTAVVRNADCDIIFRKGSWRDLLLDIENGDVDVLAGATQTPGREEFAYFTTPYRDEQFMLYVAFSRMDELGEMTFEELMESGLRIGVIEDYLYGEPVLSFQDDEKYQGQFSYSAMAEINISRLLDGEVDGIIEDKFVGASVIRQKSLQDSISLHPLRFTSSPVSIMVSRASVDEELFLRLNESVQELQASGAIEKVLAQYQNP